MIWHLGAVSTLQGAGSLNTLQDSSLLLLGPETRVKCGSVRASSHERRSLGITSGLWLREGGRSLGVDGSLGLEGLLGVESLLRKESLLGLLRLLGLESV